MKISIHKIDSDHAGFVKIDKTSGAFEKEMPDTIVKKY